mmetsp:Transcript_26458/g.60260  ORF Transcript_26458/g.60260 Transcript_26458/m.60260 type:complete len:232 (+) Transcript_26458:1005-1700(+)
MSRAWPGEPDQHVDRRCLASSVGPEHAEALAMLHAHGEGFDGDLGRISQVGGEDLLQLVDHNRVVLRLVRGLQLGHPRLLLLHVGEFRHIVLVLLVLKHLLLLVLVAQEEERVLRYPVTGVKDLVEVQGDEHENHPLHRQDLQHCRHPTPRVRGHLVPRQPLPARASGDVGVLVVLVEPAVQAPEGEEGDEGPQRVGDSRGVEEVPEAPAEPRDEREAEDEESRADGGGAG